jgi:uncharacterized protein
MDKTGLSTKDGRYQIAVTDTEVFLSVWPPANGGKVVSKATIVEELLNRNLVNFDHDFVIKIIKEAMGTPVLICNLLEKKNGRYQITVTDTEVFLSKG